VAELARLAAGQRARNHTAVKYGYLHSVLDLAVAARAGGLALRGCDAPVELQAAWEHLAADTRLRLRELHCVLAMQDELRRSSNPALVAALWGQAHVEPDGLPRFVPEGDHVVALRVLGGRASRSSPEGQAAPSLALTDPVLLKGPDTPGPRTLLLPAGRLAATVERTQSPLVGGEHEPLPGAVTFEALDPGTLHLVALPAPPRTRPPGATSACGNAASATQVHTVELDEGVRSIPLTPGGYGYAFDTGQTLTLGALRVPEDGALHARLDPAERHVELTIYEPSADLRAVLAVLRAVQRGLRERSPEQLLALASEAYSEPAGTARPEDDVTAEMLERVLRSTLGAVQRMELDMELQAVRIEGDRATLTYRHRARILLGAGGQARQMRIDDVARLELRREGRSWKVLSGL